jgi:transcription termination/antitermination protein NusG
MAKNWYIVQTTPNYENKVADAIRRKIEVDGLQESFGEVLVPSDQIEEAKDGKKVVSTRRRFPSYVFVEMDLTDQNWHFIAKIPKVAGFVGGSGGRPTPMKAAEVARIRDEQTQSQDRPRPKVVYEAGETLRIKSGPFTDFNGVVESADYDKGRVRLGVSVFGRETPIEIAFEDVEKL